MLQSNGATSNPEARRPHQTRIYSYFCRAEFTVLAGDPLSRWASMMHLDMLKFNGALVIGPNSLRLSDNSNLASTWELRPACGAPAIMYYSGEPSRERLELSRHVERTQLIPFWLLFPRLHAATWDTREFNFNTSALKATVNQCGIKFTIRVVVNPICNADSNMFGTVDLDLN